MLVEPGQGAGSFPGGRSLRRSCDMVPFTEYTVPVADRSPGPCDLPFPLDEQVQRDIMFHREWRHQGPEMISRSADARAHALNGFTRQVIRKKNKPPAGLLP